MMMMMMMVSAIILYTPTTGSIYIFHLVTLINHLAYLYRTMGGPSNREHRKENSAEISFYNLFFFFSNDICIQCLLMLQLIFRRLIFFFSFIFLLNDGILCLYIILRTGST